MEGNEECGECQQAITIDEGVYQCDVCETIMHKACASWTTSVKCMPLQKRTLRLICNKCRKFLIKLPKLMSMVEEMNNDIKSLKEEMVKLNAKKMIQEKEKQDEKEKTYSEALKGKMEEIVVIKPKNDKQKSSSTRENLQEVIDPSTLGDGVGVSKLKHVKKGGVLMCCNSKEPIENVCKKLEEKLGEGYEIKRVDKKNPKIKIKNINTKDLEDENLFAEKLVIQNTIHTDCNKIKIKILHKYTPRIQKNANSMNAIVELDPKTFETIIQNKVVHIGWKTCKIEEHINVIQCRKCRKFGHAIKQCRNEKVVCAECAGEHESCETIEKNV